jgi:Clostripain family
MPSTLLRMWENLAQGQCGMKGLHVPTPPERPWTVLAYLVADDKGGASSAADAALDLAVRKEIAAIATAASLTNTHVAIQVDFRKTPGIFRTVLKDLPIGSNVSEPDVWNVICQLAAQSNPVEEKLKEANAARVGVLVDFLRWARAACPAERYAMLFWGHANGPNGLFFDNDPGKANARPLSLPDMANALDQAIGLATVVMFRDCCMSTLETAFQLKKAARFALASQSVVPIEGQWPYAGLFAALQAGGPDLDVVRRLTVQLGEYHDRAENRVPLADVPISLLDIAGVTRLRGPIRQLVTNLQRVRKDRRFIAATHKALEGARKGDAQTFSNPGDPALVDVRSLCRNLVELKVAPLMRIAARVDKILGSDVIRAHHSQSDVFHGVSMYYKPLAPRQMRRSFIEPIDKRSYSALAMSEATTWIRIALNPLKGDGTTKVGKTARKTARKTVKTKVKTKGGKKVGRKKR